MNKRESFPLTTPQQAVWWHQILTPQLPCYNIGGTLQFDGEIQLDLWERAIAEVIRRHDALRLVLTEQEGAARQYVLDALPFMLEVHDYSVHADGEQRAWHHIRQAFTKPFSLYGEALWQTQWVQATSTRGLCLLRFHHLVADGVSIALVGHAILDAYTRLVRRCDSDVRSVAPSYLDFVASDLAYQRSEKYVEDREFWFSLFDRAPEPLFPAVVQRGERRPAQKVVWDIDRGDFLHLNELAARIGISIPHVLVGTLAIYFSRLAGNRPEVVIGTPVHNRRSAAEKGTAGMFSLMLPLRVAVDPNASFEGTLRALVANSIACLRHRRFPLYEIIGHCQKRSSQGSRLFDVTVSVEQFPGDAQIEGGRICLVTEHNGFENAPLALCLRDYEKTEKNPSVPLEFNYDPQVLSHEEVQVLVKRLQLLIRTGLEAPHTPVWQLPLVDEHERHQVLHGFNAIAAPFPAESCIHELFEAQVERTPEATALVFENRSLSYAELNAQANRLAHHLIMLGVQPNTRVAIALPRGIDLVVALLATLKAGGAYVPLDPDYPAERLAYMLRDSRPAVLLSEAACALRLLQESDVRTIWVDGPAVPWVNLPSHNLPNHGQAWAGQHLAYVFYTSGSTGQPKGVMVEHRSLVNYTLAAAALFQLSATDRVLQQNSINFDLSLEEITPALATGACLHLSRTPMAAGGAPCAASIVHLTAAHWQALVGDWHLAPELAHAQLRRVRLVNVTGDALSPKLLAQWAALDLPTRLINTYGPTETAVSCTAALLRADAQGVDQVTIGTPLPNVRVYVLDPYRQPVPIGVAGELCVGGVQVGRGYLDRPQATAERFVPDPYASEPGARMYKTGDLGRWRPDGSIEFLGRNDHQVKVRGFRIELGEIEAALRSHPEVREAVVLAREDAPGHKQLVAYVIGGAMPESLRAHLGSRLPEFMVPAAYVALDALPLTPNGKLDRKALPAPDGSAYGACAYESPQGDIETSLAHIWCQLLGLERIGRHDDFFVLGGHSLLAVQLTSRIRAALGLEVPLSELFAKPTLAGFALRVAAATDSALPAIVPVSRLKAPPLSFAQQRLWFLAQLDKRADTAYAIPGGVRLKGSLDSAALHAALNRIVARHEALRTSFALIEGTPVQLIAPPEVGLALSQVDLSYHSDAEAELDRLAAEEASAPFDLTRGPLIRGRLIRMAHDDHALLLTMHHIVSDGWSLGVLVNEFSALYAAFSQGQPDALPPLPIQYADYAVWQRRWITGEVLQRQLDFWRHHLMGAPALLELPTDRPRPPVQSHAGASLGFELDAELTAGLRALSQRHGTTLFMTLLAAWAALLARLSGQGDVVIGTPVANRHRAEIEPLIGFFVNTQALRIDLSGSPSVPQLLAQVRATSLAAQQHQDIPFEQVVEALSPVRSMAHSPIFQVMFAWQNAPEGSLDLPGLQLEPVKASSTTVKFDLELTLHDAGGRIAGSLGYACALFDRSSIERHLGHWQTLLRGLIAEDAAPVDRLPLLTPHEQQQLLLAFNDTAAAFPQERCIHQLFEEQALRTPDAPAVVFEEAVLSYADLNQQANQLAHHLIALGVRPDSRVAIALPRGTEMVVALLATLKAGGAYVPLDVEYPSERLSFMLADCRPLVLLTDAQAVRALGQLPGDLPVLDLAQRSAWCSLPAVDPAVPVQPQHLAYVIYTSGSTGLPKGVMNQHGSVVNRLLWMQRAYALRPDETVLHKTPFGFDVSVWEFFWPLLTGARLLLARPEGHKDPAYLCKLIVEQRVSTVHFVPSMLQAFLDHPGAVSCTGLSRVITSGEALSCALAERFNRVLPQAELHNLYGPTEAAVDVTAHRWETHRTYPGAGVLIGRPIDNTRIYILDAHHQLLPPGVAGEIFIAGVQVARGYLRRPDLTAERFVPDPFGEPGARMYKTGDLGRWLADGSIDYLGRNDHQVKIRGFRVESGEIEAALRLHPEVREAVVLAREDVPGDQRLVAYVLGDVAPETLRTHLSSRLPQYMVPSAYMALDVLPLTPNGKLDRKALPAPQAHAYAALAYEAPQGEIETLLAHLWHELLGIERIGRRDHFFELGGHSLLAVQLTSRIRATLGLEVPLAELFAQPTLAGYAERVAAARASALPAIVPASRLGALPLSFAQQRLWFLAQLDERAGAAYAIPGGVRLKGSLDAAALHAALNRIVARHEALRTCFGSVDGAVVQVIAPPEAGLELSHVDLSGHADPEVELERLAAEEATARFDLAHGPLIRGRLIRLADDDHALLVTMHHIVSDGWSLGVLIHEFSALYAAYAQGQPDPLPSLPIQYADYAVWQRRWMAGEVVQRQLDFWRDHLSGAPALLELPTDRPRPSVQDYAGSIVHFQLDEALSAALRALCRRHGTTLFMTLLAGWGALLSRLSGQGDVVIGTPVANRHRAEIEPLIGFFVNTQALRIDLSGSPSVAQLLAQVRATALAAQAHQDIPFEQVVEALSPIRSMAHSPVFQVMFAWQNAPEGSLDLPGLQLEPVSASSTTVKFDLELTLHDAGERIAGSLGYACALFDRSSIERHLGHWQTLLRAFIADDAAPVARLPLLTVPEQRHLLHSFNDTFAAFPQDRCIHQLFEEQVARTPDTTALVFEGASLTYRELNAQANRLAHHLIALGVRPDSRVAIALPRGIDMVVALLATLKAGGAYVPLDRDYPSERLVFMLADSSPCVLITDTATRSALGDMRDAPAVLQLDADRSWQSMSSTNPDPAVLGLTTSHLAYVIYTSGSTGQPKGAMNEHRGVVNRLLWMQQAYGLNATDAVLQKTAFGFDVSVWEFFWPLLAGARLVLARPQGQRDVTYLVDLIERERITTLHFVPSMLSAFLAAMPRSSGSSLRRVICSGEALEPHQVNLVHEQLAHARLYNLYGPTEAAIDVTAGEPQRDHLVTIGAPIANTRIFILDALGQPAPVGVAGEIHIAGVQVARGYLGRPALTAERFVPDPFGAPGSRMYKTGDLGRWQLDGSIEFLGRNDHQVKVRGFRIELGEIEAALCSHTDVRDAVVLAREDVPGDQRLVAYVIGAATPEALRAHLGSQLPQYMVPAAYVPLDALPLTSNGKLDRAALPAPDDPVRSNRYEPPRIGIERVLAKVWSKVLNLAVICREDHFFELGGHSLLAVQLVALVKQRGLGLTLQDVYAYPTLRAQSERLLGAEHSSDTRALAVRRTGTAPTLFALPTGLGDVTYAFELAAHLDTHAPVYALPWPDVMPQSMEALAAHMVQVMRVVQPAGPYRLLGYSSGALLAYAIAQLLAEQDEPVDFIGMLDCEHHTKHDDAKSPEEMARQWLLHELTIAEQTFGEHEEVRQVLRQLADDVPGTPWNELIARYEHHDSLRALTEQRHSNARQVATTYLRTALFQKLWLSYATRALPAPLKLHVFYATEGTAPQHPMGWQELMPSDQLVVVPVPGTHTSMMEPPHIGHVGRAVSQALRHIRSAPARDAEDRGDVRFHLRPTFMPQAQVENLDAANNPER